MDWLARREHARCELEKKLHRRFPDATAAIGPVLDQLEHEGLLSDARFVESFTRSRIQRGLGPLRIANALRSRGLPCAERIGVDADADAETPPTDWLAVAREARRRRFGESLPAAPVERQRQMAFLLRRGFSTSVCRAACLPPSDDA
jgi:regulatory protein